MVTTSVVLEVSGLTPNRLRYLCENGFKVGEGSGVHRIFSMPELVALTFASRLANVGFGPVVRQIVDALSAYSERELRAEFAKGNTFFLPIPGAMSLSQMPSEDSVGSILDVEATYRTVLDTLQNVKSCSISTSK